MQLSQVLAPQEAQLGRLYRAAKLRCGNNCRFLPRRWSRRGSRKRRGLALRIAPIVLAVQLMAACASGVSGPAAITASPDGCAPTDQDAYVYRPARLQALRSCVRVTGTIVASSAEADGDVHINVRLDAPLEALLVTGNAFEDGALIVEPVCQFPPLQAEAIRVCASDPDPLAGGLPRVGDHVWLEGRYVLDLQHHAWAELHPLYRWGPAAP